MEISFYMLHDGTKMCYADSGGNGRPVIFIHGMGGNKAQWINLYSESVINAGYRFIALDMRAALDTEPSKTRPVTISMLGDDIHDFILGRKLQDVTLIGHSQGGLAIMSYLLQHGNDHLHSILLADVTASNHVLDGWQYAKQNNTFTTEMGMSEVAQMREDVIAYFTGFIMRSSPEIRNSPNPDAAAKAWAEEHMSGQHPDETIDLYASSLVLDLRGFVDIVKVPTAYFYAENGVFISPGVVDYYREHIKSDFTGVSFPSTSHSFLLEQEHIDAVTMAMLSFLKK